MKNGEKEQRSPWGYSAHGKSFHGKEHEEIREICRAAGFSGVEGNASMFQDKTPGALTREGGLYRDSGVPFTTFHLPYDLECDIAAFYENTRRKAVDIAKRWLENAAALGACVMIQHPTTSSLHTDAEGFDCFLHPFGKSLGELLPVAESLGVVLAIENLPSPHGQRFGTAPEHFRVFQEEFAHPNLGFCLDAGHALITMRDRTGELYEAMKPGLRAFHLEDNAGDRDLHLAPGHGLVDWAQIAEVLADIGFSGAACIEAPPFAHGPDYSPAAWAAQRQNTEQLLATPAST